MSAPQFTKGPWTAGVWEGSVSGRSQFYGKHAAVFAPSGDMVCPCGLPEYNPENAPNAHLIAAAPELYEALDKAVGRMETIRARLCRIAVPQGTAKAELVDYIRQCEEEAEAALSKARGEAAFGLQQQRDRRIQRLAKELSEIELPER